MGDLEWLSHVKGDLFIRDIYDSKYASALEIEKLVN